MYVFLVSINPLSEQKSSRLGAAEKFTAKVAGPRSWSRRFNSSGKIVVKIVVQTKTPDSVTIGRCDIY